MVGNCGTGPSHTTCAGFAFSKMSSATISWPVSRFPLLSCARRPDATSLSTRARLRSSSGVLAEDRSGSISIRTGIRNWFARRVELERHVRHLSDLDAAELDRRAHRQPAHRLIEVEQLGDALRVVTRLGVAAVS